MYKVSIDILDKINKTLVKFSKKNQITDKDKSELKNLSKYIKDNYLQIKP